MINTHRLPHFIICFLLCACAVSVQANDSAQVDKGVSVALSAVLGSKVVLSVNGKRRILSKGQTTSEGVKLVQYSNHSATLFVNGQSVRVNIGDAPLSTHYTPKNVTEFKIFKDSSGMYRTQGLINGKNVSFLVDTGATTVAMGWGQAQGLGIDVLKESKGQIVKVSTANGITDAYPITLDKVSVGGLEAPYVKALVIKNTNMQEALLGMSYLSRVHVKHNRGVMLLSK